MTAIASAPRLGKPLSREQCLRYERQAKAVVQQTLDQYVDHIRTKASDRRVDPGRWELTKTVDCVEIYAVLASNPGGSLSSRLSAKSAANALIAGASVMECALDRMLAWLRGRQRTTSTSDNSVALATVKGSGWCCAHCSRTVAALNELSACDICHSTACSRCTTPRKLVVGTTARDLKVHPSNVCLGCLSQALSKVNCRRVAMEEWNSPRRANATTVHPTMDARKQSGNLNDTPSTQVSTPKLMLIESDILNETKASPELGRRQSSQREITTDMEYLELEPPTNGEASEWEDEDDHEEQDVELVSPVPVRKNLPDTLLLQMAALQIKAEQTYQYTTDQTLSLQRTKLGTQFRREKSVRIQPLG